jgi:hypothetical protein
MSTNVKQDINTPIEKEVTLGGLTYIVKGNITGEANITITPKETGPITPPDPNQPPKPDNFGTIKDGAKWSKNPGKAETWKIVPMTDDPKKFKIVDTTGLNVIADIGSEAEAKALIEYFKVNVFPPKGNDNSEPTDPDQPPQPPVVDGLEFPYKTTGKTVEMSQRGPTTRNYASGKPSDNTIEKNAKNIPFDNIQAVFTIEVPKEWEHDDNLSIKLGGTHMGTGWFDNGVSIYGGQTCLGKEENHPSTQSCVVKGKVYGDLRGKTVSIASTYFKSSNKTEYWVNIGGVTQGWDKGCEGTNVGGFNPKAEGETEVQLRIDGFKEMDKPPKITKFVVNEIQS